MITDCIENKEPSVEDNNTVSNTSSEDLPEPPNKVIIGINDNKDIYVGKEEGEEILERSWRWRNKTNKSSNEPVKGPRRNMFASASLFDL